MNLRTVLMIFVVSLPVSGLRAVPLLDEVDNYAGRAVTGLAHYADRIGAYFNLCKPSVSSATSDIASNVVNATGKVVEHAAKGNIGDATQAGVKGGAKALDTVKQMLDPNLEYTPVSKFVREHLTEAKIALGVVTTLVCCLVLKRVFFPKKTQPKTN